QRRLPADLVGDGALDRTQRVDVLRLGSRGERRRPGRAEGDVRVAPQLAEFHTRLGDTQRPDQFTQLGHVRAGDGRGQRTRNLDGFGDDLDERDARTVVVQQRVARPVDAPGRPAHVLGLAGVLFHVGTLDADAVRG